MKPVPGGRFCDDCSKVVHDLSAMSEEEARALLASTPKERVCVRYVYDYQTQRVVFGESDAQVIPEHRLSARLKRKLAMAAAIAAPMLVQACGGGPYGGDHASGDPSMQDAGRDADAKPDASKMDAGAIDASDDANDAGAD